jgi:hypothetical protein
MPFEGIVRPFQNAPVFTARVLAPVLPSKQEPQPARITWGGTEDASWVEEDPGYVSGFGVDLQEDKSRRVTEQVRVENPNDSTQYVEVERIKKTVMTDTQTGREFTLRFANWDKDRKG